MLLKFSTDHYKPEDRFAAWREDFCAKVMRMDLKNHAPDRPFESNVSMFMFGQLIVGRTEGTPSSYGRTKQLIQDGDDTFMFMIPRTGKEFHIQNGKDSFYLNSNSGAIISAAHEHRIIYNENFPDEHHRLQGLLIPSALIASLIKSPHKLIGQRFDYSSRVFKFLCEYIDNLLDGFPVDNPAALALAQQHVIDLVALLLRDASPDVVEQAKKRGLRAVMRQRILKYIAQHYANPALSGGMVAATLGVTERYVQQLMEEHGTTFSHYLLHYRLDKVASMLTNRAMWHMRISDIAYLCGFNDLSYFNRSFKRRFGESPRTSRK